MLGEKSGQTSLQWGDELLLKMTVMATIYNMDNSL